MILPITQIFHRMVISKYKSLWIPRLLFKRRNIFIHRWKQGNLLLLKSDVCFALMSYTGDSTTLAAMQDNSPPAIVVLLYRFVDPEERRVSMHHFTAGQHITHWDAGRLNILPRLPTDFQPRPTMMAHKVRFTIIACEVQLVRYSIMQR